MGFMFFCKVTIQIIYLRVQRTRYPEQVIHMLYHVCLYASFLTCWDACISPCQNDAHIKEFEGTAWPMPPPLRDRWQWVLWLNAISFLFLSLLDNLEGGIVLAGIPCFAPLSLQISHGCGLCTPLSSVIRSSSHSSPCEWQRELETQSTEYMAMCPT